MRQFSRIKETDNPDSKLRLCFDFVADENPAGDLHSLGLLLSAGLVRGAVHRYTGRVYVLTDSEEDLRRSQERLRQMGWVEMPEASSG